MKIDGKNSKCFDCKNAVCGCSWSENFIPVKGWIAEKIKYLSSNRIVETYFVKDCPLFINDNPKPKTNREIAAEYGISV